MKRIAKRIVLTLAVILVVLVAGGGGWLYWRARACLPQLDGAISVAGLGERVEARRDAQGVPHLRAASLEDLVFAQGYVTAQDRLWQMDLSRRLGEGELSEIFGRRTLRFDIENRTLGFRQACERAAAELDPDARRVLAAYARGVNAFISQARDRHRLPLEFLLLRYQPQPWREMDSFAVALNMAKMLSTSWHDELMRERLRAKLPAELYADLFPDHSPYDQPVAEPLPAPGSGAKQARANFFVLCPIISNRALQALTSPDEPSPAGLGSNNWVVNGSHTLSGKPLLANDPHLGHGVPSVWYMIHLQAPGLNVAGVSLPGLPLVIIGHNERIAWGMTNTGPDVQDLYRENFNPRDPNKYLHNREWVEAAVRDEVIKVRGEHDYLLTVKVTRHGPVIAQEQDSDRAAPQNPAQGGAATSGQGPQAAGSPEPSGQRGAGRPAVQSPDGRAAEQRPDLRAAGRDLALRWTALEPHALRFPFPQINRAKNWEEFTTALRDFSGPMQNFVYADVDGNIGYYAAGWVPIRKQGDGTVPAPGSTDDYDWRGYIPFEDLPHAYNPASGLLATANGRVVSDDYPYLITHKWEAPYRTARIYQLLRSGSRFTVRDMLRIQTDIHTLEDEWLARQLVSAGAQHPPQSADAQYALGLLQNWDGDARADSAATLVCEVSRHALLARLLKPKLGEDLAGYHWPMSTIFLENVFANHWTRWLPPGDTSFADTLMKSLEEGVERIPELVHNHNRHAWKWGEIIPLTFHHPLSGGLPLLGRFLDVGPFPQAGTQTTVKQTTPTVGPSMRMVVDFSNLDDSVQNITLGESGQVLSPYYHDQFEAWYNGRSFPMLFSDAAVEKGTAHKLVLEPTSH